MNEQEERAALEREIQQLREELASLDELPREDRPGSVSDLKGASDITTSVSKGIRCIPASQDRYYLELYLLQKERERLVRETASIKRRRTRVGRRLADIGEAVGEREEKAIQNMTTETRGLASEQRERPQRPPKGKRSSQKKHEYNEDEWNRMSINY